MLKNIGMFVLEFLSTKNHVRVGGGGWFQKDAFLNVIYGKRMESCLLALLRLFVSSLCTLRHSFGVSF